MSSAINISAAFGGATVVPSVSFPQIQGTAVASEQAANLSTGNNTLAVPPGSIGCFIVPPAGNTVALTLKGASGDTGIALHLTNPTVLGLGTGQTSIVINAASGVAVSIVWF